MRFFSLLLFFVLNGVYGQEFEITHKGPLKENWEFYKSKTTYIDYSTIYLCGRQPNENKYNDAKVNILFIDYTLYGGIIVTANNQTNIENDYVDDYVLKGINYYTIYSKRKENETDYKYWFYIDIDGDNTKGVEVAAIIKKTGKSTCSYDKLEKILFQHVRELQFLPLSNNNKQPTLNNNTQNDKNSSDDNSNTWTVIIGAITAGALLGIRNRRKKKKKSKEEKKLKKEKEATDYILQLNHNSFNLKPNETQNLVVKVWKITEKSKFVVNASIRVNNPEKALKIMPYSNIGTLDSQLTLKDKPANNKFNIMVTATTGGNSFQKIVSISIGGEKQILVKTTPNNTRILRPNTKQAISCYAKVVDENGKDLDALTKTIKFDGTLSKWIDLSNIVWDEGWLAINLQASDPNAIAVVSHTPKSVTLGISVDYTENNEDKQLENNLEIQLLDCKIDTNIDTISLPVSDDQTEVTFNAFIEDCDGSIPWKFEALYLTDDDKPDEPLSDIKLVQLSDIKTQVTVTGPILMPKEDEKYLRKKLVIKAQQKEEKALERHVFVTVSKEGLYIEKGTGKNHEIKFVAKGKYKHEIDFGLYRFDTETNQIIVDKKGLKNLHFELISNDKKIKNIASVLKPQFTFDDYSNAIPHARYLLEVPNKFPGFGDTYELKYHITILSNSTDKNNLNFEQNLILKVQDFGIGEGFPDWQKAYDQCKYTIIEYVPDSDQRHNLLDLLEKNKYKMDIEGMVAFRKKIWHIAHDLMINKAEGYIALANWYDAVIDTLEWVVWMGDIAFQVVLATYTGAGVGLAASAFKQTFLTGVRLAIEDKSVNDFVDEEIAAIKEMIYSTTKGRFINTQTIEKFYKGNKVKVWAIYAVATFAIQYQRLGSIPQAAKETAKQLRDEAIIRFLHGKVVEENNKLKEKTLTEEENSKTKQKESTEPTKKGTNDYEEAHTPPDVSGYTKSSMKVIQRIANKFKIKIITRPTNAAAQKLLASGQAVAKKMFVKNKTINELDTYLGASKNDIGKVGSFKPKLSAKKMSGLPEIVKNKIIQRYKQRKSEFIDQAKHIQDNYDKLFVKKGVVYDRLSGKPFTGDIDIFDIRGSHGEKLPKAKIERVVVELRKSHRISSIEHGAHVEWDWKSIKNPNDRRIAKEIYDKIMGGHSKGGEALVEFNPNSKVGTKPKSVFFKGRKDIVQL